MLKLTKKGRNTILVIDDDREILFSINEILQASYNLKVANNGEEGLFLAEIEPMPDLILLDVKMPWINGYEVCRRLKENRATRDIPVIFLANIFNDVDINLGFELGAIDFIEKPIYESILLSRVHAHLNTKQASSNLKNKNILLVKEVSKQIIELKFNQDITILTLASIVDIRDNETGNHLHRTKHYVRILAEHLQLHPRFSRKLTRKNIDLIYKSAPLHDIGKVGIPDSILLKPGRLTTEEMDIMKTHATLGQEALENAEQKVGRKAPFLTFAKEIAGCHHEKWDGSGYPNGLLGEQIPVAARLMALADVYDALVSARPYKIPFTHEVASKIILEGRGSHFDPDITDAFLAVHIAFKEIAEQYKDPSQRDV